MAKTKILFENGNVLGLTQGEITAIERMAQQNGTSPEKVQYDPGHVQRRTLLNLWRKGILRYEDGLFYFAPGYLPVLGPTIYANTPFTLTRA